MSTDGGSSGSVGLQRISQRAFDDANAVVFSSFYLWLGLSWSFGQSCAFPATAKNGRQIQDPEATSSDFQAVKTATEL